MNEEQFRSELYRHLVNEIEDSEQNLKVKFQEYSQRMCDIVLEISAILV